MSSITFEVPRLSTLVFKTFSEKKIFTIIFVVNSLNAYIVYQVHRIDAYTDLSVQRIGLPVEDILISI